MRSTAFSDHKVTGWPLLACIYLVFIQPVFLFIIPLVTYDQNRLPGIEEFYMLNLSAKAWRDVFITIYGIVIGQALWQRSPNAVRMLNRYLFITIFSSLGLMAVPFLVPFHSFLRKEIRVELATSFIQTLVTFAVGFTYFHFSKRVQRLYPQQGQMDGGRLLSPVPRQTHSRLTAMAAAVAGLTIVGAAFWTRPIDLFEAAWEGDLKAVEKFIQEGVDINTTTSRGNKPLHLSKTKEVAKLLASTSSKLEQTYLLSHDDFKNFPGLVAKLQSASDPVSSYLRGRFSPELQHNLAVARQLTEVMNLKSALLIELNGIIRGDNLLLQSQSFRSVRLAPEAIDLESKTRAGVETTRLNRLLLEAAYLLEISRCAVDIRNNHRETPLHIASFDGRFSVSQILLDLGANVNAENEYGLTPLDHALFGKSVHRRGDFDRVIALLISNGGKANSPASAIPEIAQISNPQSAGWLKWNFFSTLPHLMFFEVTDELQLSNSSRQTEHNFNRTDSSKR